MDSVLGLQPGVPGLIPSSGKFFVFCNTMPVSDRKKDVQPVTFSLGPSGASRKSSMDAPWGTPNQRFGSPGSAPLLTAVLSWRQEEERFVLYSLLYC